MPTVEMSPAGRHDTPLVRLCFQVPPERMAEFETRYEEQVVPVLKQHGLVESSGCGRTTVEGVFSRLFALRSPAEVTEKQKALQKDPAWQKVLRDIGVLFGTLGPDNLVQHSLGLYTAPARPGRVVTAGLGRGHWRSYDGVDGLGSNCVWSVFQDQEGYLWFGTAGGGVSRYDGQTFTTFTTQDGLAGNEVHLIFQDREGHLWFGTGEGVSRYDGQGWTTFTTRDGLAHNNVWSINQDQHGHFWFGTRGGGVSRYNGQAWDTFTTQDGLAGNEVRSITQDRQGNLWFGTGTAWSEDGGISRYDGRTFTSFTVQDGLGHNVVSSVFQDQHGHFWFGTRGGGVSQYDGQIWDTFTTQDGLVHNDVRSITQDREGYLWFGTNGGVSRYDGKSWISFTTQDGLAGNQVWSITQDREGYLWFGTNGGVSRYDRQVFVTFSPEDGLVNNEVQSILQDREGYLWFGTRAGVSRYDGQAFTTFTTEEGLASNVVISIFQDRAGRLWFGCDGGVSRYDGQTFATFTTEDGLVSRRVFSISQDREGHLWFGTMEDGVSRFDGQTFTTFTMEDGLASNNIWSIVQDRRGYLWFGTSGGVSCYDGKTFTTLTTKNGLAHDVVTSIFQDQEGYLWFGTWGGMSCYDGKTFTTLTTKDGLTHDMVSSIFQDQEGHLWFGTRGGVSRYDGQVFQTLTRQDGLSSNVVSSILQDEDRYIWLGTANGVMRCRPPSPSPPRIFIDAVVADRRYEGVEDLTVSALGGLITFEFHGMSFKTRPEAMVYRYRLQGYDGGWQNTHARRVEYPNLLIGEYTFEVVAVDRDLVYSEEPVAVHLTVVRDPRDEQIDELEQRVRERTGELEKIHKKLEEAQAQLIADLEKELQTAHDLQMGLMPKESPRIEGFEVSGRCTPANHVGGDFFQYFPADGRLSLCLADVTGHAMEAAVPVMMFSGILKSQMELGSPVEELFGRLNRSLYGTLGGHTFVCFAMGELDLVQRTLRLSDSGCPYPYHYQAARGEVVELRVDAYPLGIRPDTTYPVIEAQLEPGDRVVFCSDGIIEAANGAGELFGFERTTGLICQGCREGLPAEALLERLMGEVRSFRGEVPQGDDQTVVVLAVES